MTTNVMMMNTRAGVLSAAHSLANATVSASAVQAVQGASVGLRMFTSGGTSPAHFHSKGSEGYFVEHRWIEEEPLPGRWVAPTRFQDLFARVARSRGLSELDFFLWLYLRDDLPPLHSRVQEPIEEALR